MGGKCHRPAGYAREENINTVYWPPRLVMRSAASIDATVDADAANRRQDFAGAGLRLVHAFAFGCLSAAECVLINLIFVGINQLRERYLLLKFSQQKLSVGFKNIFR